MKSLTVHAGSGIVVSAHNRFASPHPHTHTLLPYEAAGGTISPKQEIFNHLGIPVRPKLGWREQRVTTLPLLETISPQVPNMTNQNLGVRSTNLLSIRAGRQPHEEALASTSTLQACRHEADMIQLGCSRILHTTSIICFVFVSL